MTRWYAIPAAVLLAAATVQAQIEGELSAPATAGLTPVDQGVADMGPNSTSLRRVEAGLRVDGEQTSLFRLDPVDLTQKPTYYRVGPGFRARVDRLEYLVIDKDDPGTRRRPNFALNQQARVDGEFVEIIGPNTVFELTLRPAASRMLPPEPLPDARLDAQIDHRLDARVGGPLDARVDTKLQPTLIGEQTP